MRQAGILAAAGIVALEEIVPRLAEDHRRAQQLAEGLQNVPGLELEPGSPRTNMVYCSLSTGVPYDAKHVTRELAAQDVLVGAVAARRFRLVTHYWIDEPAIQRTVSAFNKVLHSVTI